MKKLVIAFAFGAMALTAQAQKKSGAIQFVTTLDPAAMASANGMQLSDEMKARMPKAVKSNFELLFNATGASYMPVEETEDSNGGGGGFNPGRMMMRFGGAGGNREYYYSFANKGLSEVFDMNDTTYAMSSKLTVDVTRPNFRPNNGGQQGGNQNGQQTISAIQYLDVPPTIEVVKSDETKQVAGFNCKKAIVKVTRKAKVLDQDKDIIDETTLWYTNDLGFDFSPNPKLWTEGAVLAIESRGANTLATSTEFRNVSQKDVTAPKKATPITAEQYAAKMQAMVKRFQGGRPGGNGNVRSVIIN